MTGESLHYTICTACGQRFSRHYAHRGVKGRMDPFPAHCLQCGGKCVAVPRQVGFRVGDPIHPQGGHHWVKVDLV